MNSTAAGRMMSAAYCMSDTVGGRLAHAMSESIEAYRINGRAVGKMESAAYLAGELGIPWTFASGDLHPCRETDV